ncbi:MAG TPA: DNA polymerase III subunit delta [Ardenticatenaceae bacterium]|nr:DNA polymerase III subunit delta [Ardenticatenaceae bacterium]
MFYIFYGADDLARDEALNAILARVPDPTMAELNTTRLDGRRVSFAELRHSCDSIPFLAERRIVIVEGLLERLKNGPKELADQVRDYLGALPEHARLFLIEGDKIDKRLAVWKRAEQLAEAKQGVIREFEKPRREQLPRWIQARTRQKGGRIEPRAADELATLVGDDLRLLDSEIDKLVTYAADETIEVRTVRLMVPYAAEANIFELMDALSQRDTRRALGSLEQLLDGQAAPTYLHFMLTRQIRILLQVKELSELGSTIAEIRQKLGLHPFVVDKALKQVKKFTLEDLEAAFERLLESDIAMKTGRTEPELALQLLVADLASGK